MIVDKKEFDNFISILPDLEKDEVFFISLSARNKYLTKEEREHYCLGRTEMFSRSIVKRKDQFSYIMKKLKASLIYKTTKNDSNIPEKALVCYSNINPSSMLKAYSMLLDEMNKETYEVTKALMEKRAPNYDGIIHLERKLMNCIQKSRSRKYFVDVDFDTYNFDYVAEFLNDYLVECPYHIIKTHGGYHLLLHPSAITGGELFYKKISFLNEKVKNEGGEVTINKNQMVPVPGTNQAGILVKIVTVPAVLKKTDNPFD